MFKKVQKKISVGNIRGKSVDNSVDNLWMTVHRVFRKKEWFCLMAKSKLDPAKGNTWLIVTMGLN